MFATINIQSTWLQIHYFIGYQKGREKDERARQSALIKFVVVKTKTQWKKKKRWKSWLFSTYTLAWGFFFEKSQAKPKSDIRTCPCSSSKMLAGWKRMEKIRLDFCVTHKDNEQTHKVFVGWTFTPSNYLKRNSNKLTSSMYFQTFSTDYFKE